MGEGLEPRPYEVEELHAFGMPLAAIAARYGVAEGLVRLRLRQARKQRQADEPATREESVAREVERLDALLSVAWEQAKKGDVKALEFVLKVSERRAKLLGLDAPTKGDAAARPEGTVLNDDDCLALRDRFRAIARHLRSGGDAAGDDAVLSSGVGEGADAPG